MSPLTNMFAIRGNPLGILQGAPAYRKKSDEEILYGPDSPQAQLNPGWTDDSGNVTKKGINEYYAKREVDMETVETDYPFLADPNFQVELNNILSQNPNINKKDIYQIISGESSYNPVAKNPDSSATGLFQFIESTAKNLGTTTDEISKMTPAQQLNLYGRYINNYNDAKAKSPDFVINIKEDGSYEDFDEEAFEKMFPPLDRPAQDDSNNIVPELTVKDIPVSPPSAIDMMRNNYREGSIKRQNLSKQYKEGEVSDRPTVIPLFPKEPLTKQEADVLKRAQDVDQEFNYKKNDMLNAEKGFIPQQVQPQQNADVAQSYTQSGFGIPGNSISARNRFKDKTATDSSTIDGEEFVHEKGLTQEEVLALYNSSKQSNSVSDTDMPTGVGILQDMSNAVKVPFIQDDFAFDQNETAGLDRARNLLGEPTTVYRDINGNLVDPNSEKQKPNNLRYLAGLLGSIMADRYGNPSQPEDNFSKYMAYTQDAIKQQRLDKQAIESQFGNYRNEKGEVVYGGPTPDGSFQTIPGYTAIDNSDSVGGFPKAVDMGGGITIMMDKNMYEKHQETQGKEAGERVENLSSIRQTNFTNNKDFNELLNYSDDQLNKLFGQSGILDNQIRRDVIGANDDSYKKIKTIYDFINDNKAKKAYVDILKGAGSISNYETEIMAKTINKLNVKMSAETLREEIAKIQFLGQFHEHNTAAGIPGYSDSSGTYSKLDTKEAYDLFLNNEIEDLNGYLNYKSRQ
jgi:hypothetical protein